jgi:hypothetical protein
MVNWQNTNVSRTISVLVLMVLMYLENQSVSDIGLLQIHQFPEDEDRDGP